MMLKSILLFAAFALVALVYASAGAGAVAQVNDVVSARTAAIDAALGK